MIKSPLPSHGARVSQLGANRAAEHRLRGSLGRGWIRWDSAKCSQVDVFHNNHISSPGFWLTQTAWLLWFQLWELCFLGRGEAQSQEEDGQTDGLSAGLMFSGSTALFTWAPSDAAITLSLAGTELPMKQQQKKYTKKQRPTPWALRMLDSFF